MTLVAAAQLLDSADEGWTAEQLERLRTLLCDEYVGPDRDGAIAAVNCLLG